MVPFKFFEGKVYKDEYTIPVGYINVPPYGISRRHWNIMPGDIREGTEEEMVAFIQGWETTDVMDIMDRPYENLILGALWYRGYAHRQSRMTRREELQPTDQAYYHTDEFMFFDVTEIQYDEVNGLHYKHMLFRHIEQGNTVEGQRIYSEHPMWNFPDIM